MNHDFPVLFFMKGDEVSVVFLLCTFYHMVPFISVWFVVVPFCNFAVFMIQSIFVSDKIAYGIWKPRISIRVYLSISSLFYFYYFRCVRDVVDFSSTYFWNNCEILLVPFTVYPKHESVCSSVMEQLTWKMGHDRRYLPPECHLMNNLDQCNYPQLSISIVSRV